MADITENNFGGDCNQPPEPPCPPQGGNTGGSEELAKWSLKPAAEGASGPIDNGAGQGPVEAGAPEQPCPVTITYSCIYEWYAVCDCSMGNVAQDFNFNNEAYGSMITRTLANPLKINTRTGGMNTVGIPYSQPTFIGHVRIPDEFNKFIPGNPAFEGIPTNQWIDGTNHNQLTKPYRYLLLKYYQKIDTEAQAPEQNPDGTWTHHFTCPVRPTTVPPQPYNEFGTLTAGCPRYYKLTACTNCAGETDDNVKVKYWEAPRPITVNGPIIRYPDPYIFWTAGGVVKTAPSQCHRIESLAKGPRTGTNVFTRLDEKYNLSLVTNNGIRDPWTWRNAGLSANWSENNDAGYTEHNDCSECGSDIYLAVSIVGQQFWDLAGPAWGINQLYPPWQPDGNINRWDAHICQSSQVRDLDMTVPANQRHVSACVNAGLVFLMKVRAKSANETWLNNNGDSGYFIGTDGRCRQYNVIRPADQGGCIPKFIDNLTKWWGRTGGARPVQNRNSFYANLVGLTRYGSECDCYDNGGTVGTMEEVCNPPILPPTIDAGPCIGGNPMTVNEGQRVTFRVSAHHFDQAGTNLGSNGLKYDWWFLGNAPGSTPQRLTRSRGTAPGYVIRKAKLNQAGSYFVRIYNRDEDGNWQYTESIPCSLTVIDVPTKLYPDNQEVAVVTVYAANLATVGAFRAYIYRGILGKWVPNAPAFTTVLRGNMGGAKPVGSPTTSLRWTTSNIEQWRDIMNGAFFSQDFPLYYRPAEHWCAKAVGVRIREWKDLSKTLRGLVAPNNDEDDRYSLEKAGLPSSPKKWKEDITDWFPRGGGWPI